MRVAMIAISVAMAWSVSTAARAELAPPEHRLHPRRRPRLDRPRVLGGKYYETPNIDRLAAGGMRFTDAYAAARTAADPRRHPERASTRPRTGVSPTGASKRFDTSKRPLIPVPNVQRAAAGQRSRSPRR